MDAITLMLLLNLLNLIPTAPPEVGRWSFDSMHLGRVAHGPYDSKGQCERAAAKLLRDAHIHRIWISTCQREGDMR